MDSSAKIRANKKYSEKEYWRFSVTIKKEYKPLIEERCEELGGITASKYLNLLVERDIEGFESIGEATKKGDKRK